MEPQHLNVAILWLLYSTAPLADEHALKLLKAVKEDWVRGILIHGRFGVDPELAWKVAKEEIPCLKRRMPEIREELEGE